MMNDLPAFKRRRREQLQVFERRKASEDNPTYVLTSSSPDTYTGNFVINKQSQPTSSTIPKPEEDGVANIGLASILHNYDNDEDED
ncbi:unnamed protein product [Microthlaspi erraticum]|uniref:Uncharacterized protein n=1 Tax=Microthlaspi erraticum TaxID=1685480 RepID=A0A6D2IA11_9BRAS|nr:unnamed protein product [Microthlaspi erraticum]